jgi:iron complex transport system ATP-binding protein
VIAAEAVVARYPRARVPALAGVSFEAHSGALTVVAGPNGSGKSTLVRLLLGRLPLEGGRLTIEGVDVATLDPIARARRVAVVTQREEPAFPIGVRDYVALGRFPHVSAWGAPGPGHARAVERALVEAEAEALADRDTDELSGGEWQRVRIARALAQGGEAVVLDEPTTFLDVSHEMAVFELAATLARGGRAVLLVSHQLNLVARFATSLVLLHAGRVVAHGPPTVVMDGPTLERVYDWPLVVTRDPAVGAPALLPLRGGTRRPSG